MTEAAPGDMRSYQNIRHFPQRGIRRERLFFEHIENRARDAPLFERADERVRVNKTPAPDIYKQRVTLHQAEAVII